MNWNILNSIDQLLKIDEKSKNKIQILFKHSTRCSVSTFAKKILEIKGDGFATCVLLLVA